VRRVAIIILTVSLLASCSSSSKPRAQAPAPAAQGSTVDADAVGVADWTQYGHDLANARLNSHETQITHDTVARLTKSWERDGLVGVSGTPTISGNTVYFGDWKGMLHAADVATGRDRWTTAVGGWVIGAPALAGDAVYASSGANLYRVDAATGHIRWKAVVDTHSITQINASPVVVDDVVLQGVASIEDATNGGDNSFRGSIAAYDTATGNVRWRFFTTPNDKTAGDDVGIWSTPAVDRARGVLYVGTGNTSSEPTAPLADSIIAVDYHTGQLKWSRQFTSPDVFGGGNFKGPDADVGASPNLWTSNGRAFVGAGDKAGVYHALDRDTGAVVWDTRLSQGGFFGGTIGSAAFVDGKLIASANDGKTMNSSEVFALDPATGKKVWVSQQFAKTIFAPVSAVPGIAFVGTSDSVMTALDSATGKPLWTFHPPDKTACGPSIVGGRVIWGYGYSLFGGPGKGGVISFTLPS
jgi:polyvinyl alcohol dehydrogenase (cytochrome)